MRVCSTVLPLTISSSERTPLDVSVSFAIALDFFPVFISLLYCCASVSVFLLLPFNKRICSAFPSLYSPSRSPSCHCLSRLAIVLDKDPSISDFVLHSNKCGKIFAACIAKLFLLFSIRMFKVLLRVSMKL